MKNPILLTTFINTIVFTIVAGISHAQSYQIKIVEKSGDFQCLKERKWD